MKARPQTLGAVQTLGVLLLGTCALAAITVVVLALTTGLALAPRDQCLMAIPSLWFASRLRAARRTEIRRWLRYGSVYYAWLTITPCLLYGWQPRYPSHGDTEQGIIAALAATGVLCLAMAILAWISRGASGVEREDS